MRRPIIAGNWKMNKTPDEALALVEELLPLIENADCDVVLCPPAVCLPAMAQALQGSRVGLGAQNMHFQPCGAYTGELSAEMLVSVGCQYVILGHSERRQFFAETDETVNKKVHAALMAGLTPIICVGESLEERNGNMTEAKIAPQVQIALSGLAAEQVTQCVIAYEPIWAIGTGMTATDQQANDTIGLIRRTVAQSYGPGAAAAVRIQYGGSMNESNAKGLMAQPEIDGGLIGSASLTAKKFAQVVCFEA